jgi:uncharacterized surface protein with fasciclin (FAS1) repeats
MWRRLSTLVVGPVALALGLTLAGPPAQAKALGTRSLAAVLTSDNNTFDRNPQDFDITTEAVLAVLDAKPGSPVAVLADGSTPLTAFVPTDRAFKRLAGDLLGRTFLSERVVFNRLAATLGIDTIEAVLLYHVVPGARVLKNAALRADGARLTTASGQHLIVNVERTRPRVRLIDRDPDALNPRVVKFNLNQGNRQIAHGINRVLRPVDL